MLGGNTFCFNDEPTLRHVANSLQRSYLVYEPFTGAWTEDAEIYPLECRRISTSFLIFRPADVRQAVFGPKLRDAVLDLHMEVGTTITSIPSCYVSIEAFETIEPEVENPEASDSDLDSVMAG